MKEYFNTAVDEKKTLFLTYWYPGKTNPNSGLFIKRHAHALNQKYPIVILSFLVVKTSSLFKINKLLFFDENNIETHQIYIETKFDKIVYLLLPLHYFIIKAHINKEIIPKFRFNIIHSNILFPCSIIGYFLSNKFKSKHIITEHWSKIDKFFNISLYKRLGKSALNKANAITCVSEPLKKTLQHYTINKNIQIIPNIIDSSQFFYDYSIQKNKILTFIAIAHWAEPKNPFYFLNALNELIIEKKITDFKLVLIGTGTQLEKIKSNKYNFNIEYKGNLSSQNINMELNKSHIFLHGSDFETFSVVIAEALLCGLPCIVSPVGIASEVINQHNGFIATNTTEDWKEKIITVLSIKYKNQNISDQLKEKYTYQYVGKLFEKIYSTL